MIFCQKSEIALSMIFRIQDGRIPPFFFASTILSNHPGPSRQFRCSKNNWKSQETWEHIWANITVFCWCFVETHTFLKHMINIYMHKSRFHFHKVGVKMKKTARNYHPEVYDLDLHRNLWALKRRLPREEKTWSEFTWKTYQVPIFFCWNQLRWANAVLQVLYMSILHWLFHQRVMLWLQNERFQDINKSDLSAIPGTLRAWAAST